MTLIWQNNYSNFEIIPIIILLSASLRALYLEHINAAASEEKGYIVGASILGSLSWVYQYRLNAIPIGYDAPNFMVLSIVYTTY